MSPTIHREGPYRFYFNSREESRMHVHVEAHEERFRDAWHKYFSCARKLCQWDKSIDLSYALQMTTFACTLFLSLKR